MKTALCFWIVMALVGWGWGQSLLDYEGPLPTDPDLISQPVQLQTYCPSILEKRLVVPRGKDYALAEWRYPSGCKGDAAFYKLEIENLLPNHRYWILITMPKTKVYNGANWEYQYQTPQASEISLYRNLEISIDDVNGNRLRFCDDYSSKWSDGLDTLAILCFVPMNSVETQIILNILNCGIPIEGISPRFEVCVAMELDLAVVSGMPESPNSLPNNNAAVTRSYEFDPDNFAINPNGVRIDPPDPIVIRRVADECMFVDTPRSKLSSWVENEPIYVGGYGFDPIQKHCAASNNGIVESEIRKGLHNLKIYYFIPEENSSYKFTLKDPNRPTSLLVFADHSYPSQWPTHSGSPTFQDIVMTRIAPEVCNDIAVGNQSLVVGLPGRMKGLEFIGASSATLDNDGPIEVFPCQQNPFEFYKDSLYFILVSGPVSAYPLHLSDTISGVFVVKSCNCGGMERVEIPLPPDHPKDYDTYTWINFWPDNFNSRRLNIVNADFQGELTVYRFQDKEQYDSYAPIGSRKVMPRTRNQSIDILNVNSCEGLRILIAYKGDALIHLDMEAESLDPPPESRARRRKS
jgi:hypothetical protein